MKNLLARFWKEEEGMGTVEIVIIIAVLVGIAVAFRGQITTFVNDMMARVFKADVVPETSAAP